jgi:hypothetical protein
MPSPTQIGWTAGVVDGEGCIFASFYEKGRQSTKWTLEVTVCNTDVRLLVCLQELWGGTVRKCSPRKDSNHRQLWSWYLLNRDVKPFLLGIRDALVIKKEQADLAIEFGGLLYARGVRNRWNPLSEENRRRRGELITELRLAKGRIQKKVS